jgi:hypothetical protein
MRYLRLSNKGFSNVFLSVPPQLRSFSIDELQPALEIVPPAIAVDEPAFIGRKWLNTTVDTLIENMKLKDTDMTRVAPAALIRCSRGGKTRALKEVALRLKATVNQVAVLLVSFNGFSSIKDWEQGDPVAALCRRIAFVARRPDSSDASHDLVKEYNKRFANADVKPEQILEWLGDTPCVLLIDELNNITNLKTADWSPGRMLATFLKENFLASANRYLVFTSHVADTSGQLVSFMDSTSARGALVMELPTVDDLMEAIRAFNFVGLSASFAVYYGLVPALIFLAHLSETNPQSMPTSKRELAIKTCIAQNLVTNASVVNLLETFVTGEKKNVLEPLLQLMDTGKFQKIRWIPFHMMEVLHSFGTTTPSPVNEDLRMILRKICTLFFQFREASDSSGKAWEHLFVLVLLIRISTQLFDGHVLCTTSVASMSTSTSYNSLWLPSGEDKQPFYKVKNIDQMIRGMQKPGKYPHIAVYYPSNAQFPLYDVLVAEYDFAGNRSLHGFQLKEGKATASAKPHPDVRSVLVRGSSSTNTKVTHNGWLVLGTDDVNTFFGYSGEHWTPDKLKYLCMSSVSESV